MTVQNPTPDCGEGVHLMGTSNSQIVANRIKDNSGGVLMTDETGPTDGDIVAHNQVLDNTADCGITLAGHNPAAAPGGIPNPAAGGVYDNLIVDNVSAGNGILGQGGGVLLAAGIPIGGGAVYDNTVRGNFLKGNGLAGVTVHNHFPGQDLNGNRIVGNRIGTNNLDGDPDFGPVVDPSTTGIFVGTAGNPMTITIKHNVIFSNEIGIFLTGRSTPKTSTATCSSTSRPTSSGRELNARDGLLESGEPVAAFKSVAADCRCPSMCSARAPCCAVPAP